VSGAALRFFLGCFLSFFSPEFDEGDEGKEQPRRDENEGGIK
jgi:hypothetical protein